MAIQAGSFEYIEAKIRSEANGTEFGRDFEWLCKWYLENAAIYRGQFRKVWRWSEWPDRWGRDCGIDLIAENHDGEFYAIQCKAVSQQHTVTKAEIDSFLSESNRRTIDYRLLIATTDNIGANAMRTIENQAVHASVVLRGDLVSAEIEWPNKIGGTALKPPRWKPRPHQQAAIKSVVAGFKKHDRGRLIMACGTGKTLTGLWINEAIKSRCTLLLVPSISLVQQNLKEWGRHAKEDFDYLVVCSDESVTSDRDDPAMRYIANLGVKPTTDATEIGDFLAKRRSRPTLVISTYQSCDRVAKGQAKAKKKFDLTICDEAHRLVGHVDSHFATVLDDRKIRSHRRLFMTATPRYFTQRAKDRGAEQDIKLVSMDDESLFGHEFHVLSFHDAITATPEPLLTDYQVVVIGVTDAEAKAWVADAKFVRTKDGLETDARTLAAQIGLAKAVKEYNLQRMITFHRSIARASRFVDEERRDSLPAVIGKLPPASRPTGRLWARHVSGKTPASKRASLVKELAELPSGVRGLISNCACLGEGVDVPALDGVAFIDPKGSVVDIIQAVGRVIRKAPDKKIGTIVIPVFVDESEDADHALESSAFQPVWQVLKALRAHDRRLADELDHLRTSLGDQPAPGRRVKLPSNVILDVPQLLLTDFERAFYVRAVEKATEKGLLSIDQILAWADEYHRAHGRWPTLTSGVIPGTHESWAAISSALQAGLRGLPGGPTLPQLLREHRGHKYHLARDPLTIEQILAWADAYKAAHGKWPNQKSGAIDGTDQTWSAINQALSIGSHSLPGGITLPELLKGERGHRSHLDTSRLNVEQILEWADAYHASQGKWPTARSGAIPSTDATWAVVNSSLKAGFRGLDSGSSLPQLLHEHRGYIPQAKRQRLTLELILKYADAYHDANGRWPTSSSGTIEGTADTWSGVCQALRLCGRGLPSGWTLARLLKKFRGHSLQADKAPLAVEQILAWADGYYALHGKWPATLSGLIPGTSETWLRVNGALQKGLRGLPGGITLRELLREKRGHRSHLDKPRLSISIILTWVDEYRERTGKWPNTTSGRVEGTEETWSGINEVLCEGFRGLPRGQSLVDVLRQHRGYASRLDKPALKEDDILAWADAHLVANGRWPTQTSGAIEGTDETWAMVNSALTNGLRGLSGGSSLARLLRERRGGSAQPERPPLTVHQILQWVDAYHAAHGKWPTTSSGEIHGTSENWTAIDAALHNGYRGLPGGSRIASLLLEHRGVGSRTPRPTLTRELIIAWADSYLAEHGDWPTVESGAVSGTGYSWRAIESGLRRGVQGLTGSRTLARLLNEERGRVLRGNKPALTHQQILVWADAYYARHGKWPTQTSGPVDGTDETWNGVCAAMFLGNRGLPEKQTLPMLLKEARGHRLQSDKPRLSDEQLMAWIDEFKAKHGSWPTSKSGAIDGTEDTWASINSALRSGCRGLSGDTSLTQFLKRHRGHVPQHEKDSLTVEGILQWADAHRSLTGKWPNRTSGSIPGTSETWSTVNSALMSGGRGLPGAGSLAALLHEHRDFVARTRKPPLTVAQILQWADVFFAEHGKWPSQDGGGIAGTDENWSRINSALAAGSRGLPSGQTLPSLLREHRNHVPKNDKPQLSVNTIVAWATEYQQTHGRWPTSQSGPIPGTQESWATIASSLRSGFRGLPGGMSLRDLSQGR
jgi:superfamily II DNA or RNA helicase